MNGPSLTNLDESQVKNAIGTLNQELASIDMSNTNSNLAKTDAAIEKINKTISDLKKSTDGLSTGNAQQQLDELIAKYNTVKSVIESSVSAQRSGVEQIVMQLGSMNDAITNANENSKKLGEFKVGDANAVNQFKQSILEISNSFEHMNRVSDFITIDASTIEESKQAINGFVNTTSANLGNALNIADAIVKSCDDPRIKSSLNDVISTVSNMLHELPDSVAESAKRSFQQISNQYSSQFNVQAPVQQLQLGTNIGQADLHNANAQAGILTGIEHSAQNMSSAQFNAAGFESNFNNMGKTINNSTRDINSIKGNYENDNYNYFDKKRMAAAGLGEDNLENIHDKLSGAGSVVSDYKNKRNNVSAALVKFQGAYSTYEKDQTPENLKKAQGASKDVEKQAEAAGKAAADIMAITSQIGNIVKVTEAEYKLLPEHGKKMVDQAKEFQTINQNVAQDLLGLFDDFPMESGKMTEILKQGLGESKVEAMTISDIFSNVGKDVGASFDGILSKIAPLTNALSSVMKGAQKVGGTMNAMGMGVGIPLSVSELKGYAGDVTKYYKEFGTMDKDSTMAQYAQGASGINKSELQKNRDEGRRLYKTTGGLVTETEYSDTANSLISNVQGHYGADAGKDKAAGQQDMYAMSSTALDLSKVYGVDSEGAIKSFYKELNMSAKETDDTMMRLTSTAQSANIPVSEYIKTIAGMAVNFKDAGISMSVVETGMRNLTLSGMSTSTASGIMNDTKGAITKMDDDWGSAAYYGMRSGVASDPFSAIKTMNNKYDSKGNPIAGSAEATLSAIDSKVNLESSAWGNDPSQKWDGTYKAFQSAGFSDKSANMLTNSKLVDGADKNTLTALMTKQQNADSKPAGQQDLEDKLVAAGESQDKLTLATVANTAVQQDLAQINMAALDATGNALRKTIEGMQGKIEGLDNALLGLNSPILGLIKIMGDNPLITILTLIAGKIGLNVVGNVAGNKIMGAVKGLFKGGGGAAATDAAEAVGAEGLTTAATVGTGGLEAATATTAAETAAAAAAAAETVATTTAATAAVTATGAEALLGTAATLEAVGVATDATVVGAPVGLIIGIAGAAIAAAGGIAYLIHNSNSSDAKTSSAGTSSSYLTGNSSTGPTYSYSGSSVYGESTPTLKTKAGGAAAGLAAGNSGVMDGYAYNKLTSVTSATDSSALSSDKKSTMDELHELNKNQSATHELSDAAYKTQQEKLEAMIKSDTDQINKLDDINTSIKNGNKSLSSIEEVRNAAGQIVDGPAVPANLVASNNASRTLTTEKLTTAQQTQIDSAKNGMKAPIYVNGSVEYSNGTQHYNPTAFHNDNDKLTYTNQQGIARGMSLAFDKPTNNQYSATASYADNLSSIYNQPNKTPAFNINISADGQSGVDYDKMAKQVQAAVTTVVQGIMGSSTKVAASNYSRANSQY